MKYCEKFAALLDAYVDGELSAQEMSQVQVHLESCHGCQSYVDDALAIRAAFPEVEDTLVPDGFADGVAAMVRADAAPQKKPKSRWIKGVLPLVACLAVVVLVQSGTLFDGISKNSTSDVSAAVAGADMAPYAAPEMAEVAPEGEVEMDDGVSDQMEPDSGTGGIMQNKMTPSPDMGSFAMADPIEGQDLAIDSGRGGYRVFASISLTESQVGDLLQEASLVSQDAEAKCYALAAAAYDTLLTVLAEDGIDPEETISVPEYRDEAQGRALVYVTLN